MLVQTFFVEEGWENGNDEFFTRVRAPTVEKPVPEKAANK